MRFPSIVPGGRDQTVHIIEDDFGCIGRAYVETDVEAASLEDIIDRPISGEYNDPMRVIAFNTAEGWSRDLSEDVARAIADRCARDMEPLPSHLTNFVEAYLGVVAAA